MSHVSAVKMEVNDVDALDAACKQLGTVELVRNQKTHKWYGRWVNDYSAADAAYKNGIDTKDYGKCEHAIRVIGNDNAYEVGVVRTKDGKLTLIYDNWAGGKGLEAVIGKGLSKLKQAYSAQCHKKAMLKKGFKIETKVHPVTGKPQLVARRTV